MVSSSIFLLSFSSFYLTYRRYYRYRSKKPLHKNLQHLILETKNLEFFLYLYNRYKTVSVFFKFLVISFFSFQFSKCLRIDVVTSSIATKVFSLITVFKRLVFGLKSFVSITNSFRYLIVFKLLVLELGT
uniref:Uncharacterized protein n=1 Tax=Cacopsylla melanoneura TaxID=428564 RepID=A0A8D8XFS0_9HEMI